jgi:peptidyl-prolyl cis-trans isomerase-like protein 2
MHDLLKCAGPHASAGGGGKRAEAKRLLAEAAVRRGSAAAAAANGGSKQQQQQPAGAGSKTGTAAAAAGEKDWRLTAPAKQKLPDFKPGAVTWDTDDYSTAAGAKQLQKQQAQKAAAAGGAAGAAAIAARPNPKAWYDDHHAQYKQSAFTTGARGHMLLLLLCVLSLDLPDVFVARGCLYRVLKCLAGSQIAW